MNKISLNILILTIALILLISCQNNINGVTGVNTSIPTIKSVTKWQCNVNTNEKVSMLDYKEYSEDGHLTKEIDYSSAGSIEYVSNFSYANSQSIEQKTYYNLLGVADSTNFTTYQYNGSGYISKKIDCNSFGDTVSISNYEYNNKGYIIKTTEIQTISNEENTTNYQYSYNNLGKISSVSINNDITQTKDSIIYEPNVNKIVTTTYSSTGDILTYKTYIYNSYGNLTSELIFTNQNVLISKSIYEYVYY